jgi:hypothetical protein
MRARLCGSVVIWLMALAASGSALTQGSTFQFERHSFTLQLPPGYGPAGDVSPGPGVRTFGFSTEPRSDGTRGMIQVTLVDLKQAGAPDNVTVEKLAATMIDAVHQRRTDWIQKAADQQIDGVPGRRIEWWGSVQTARFHGVLIVGMKKDVAFALQTQDLSSHAASTVGDCEKSLLSFGLTVKR